MSDSRKRKKCIPLRILVWTVIGLAVLFDVACASMGRPGGGPQDMLPPEFVRANPAPGQVNVSPNRVDVWFNENIALDDAFNKVVVSPTQKQTPVVRSLGRHLTVELRDTLLPNTTYTIDFADAVKDLNEGNVLDGFAIDFATGPELDTMRISGIVLEARTLEPAQGITVGIYPADKMADTTLTRVPFERLARTNTYGQFTVRNLKPGRYAVFAVNDINRDHLWDRSEDIAYYDAYVEPSVQAITVSDTLRTADDTDSIVTRPGVEYLPNDVLLTWFNEGYQPQYVKDYARPERNRIIFNYGAPTDSLPTLTVASGPLAGRNIDDMAVRLRSQRGDSLEYWLRDPELLAVDSLLLSVRHEGTDTLQQTVWQTDTLRFFWREPKKKEEKKKKKDDEEADSIPPVPAMSISMLSKAQHQYYEPLRMRSTVPVDSFDADMFHLEVQVDTLWEEWGIDLVRPDSLNPYMGLQIDFERDPGMKYRLTVDSAAVSDIYGLVNKPIKNEFTVRALEEYSSLTFNVTGPDSIPFVVELLNASDQPVRTAASASDGTATFKYVEPGTYFARLFLDSNGNGTWDTGSVADSIQPEEVYYYPKSIDLRANWEVNQPWNIYELALDAQKPMRIKKNKPKLKKGEVAPLEDDGEVEYDEWGDPIDPNSRDPFRDRRGNNNRNSFGGLGGGLQQSSGNSAIINRR